MELFFAFVATLIFGPLAFWALSRLSGNEYVFPSNITGAVGDTIFFPLFNALAVYYGLLINLKNVGYVFWLSLLAAGIIAVLYGVYRKKNRASGKWMYVGNSFSVAGWYHIGFVAVQAFIIVSSLLYFPDSVLLWLVLLGYIATILSRKHFHGKS